MCQFLTRLSADVLLFSRPLQTGVTVATAASLPSLFYHSSYPPASRQSPSLPRRVHACTWESCFTVIVFSMFMCVFMFVCVCVCRWTWGWYTSLLWWSHTSSSPLSWWRKWSGTSFSSAGSTATKDSSKRSVPSLLRFLHFYLLTVARGSWVTPSWSPFKLAQHIDLV